MLTLLTNVLARRELLFILIGRNLKIRYKNSVLGFFWSLLIPLFMILIYAVFAHMLKFSGGQTHYLEFLIIGIVTWQFLVMCLNDSLSAILGNANLVKKAAFPRIILPLSMVMANLVNFLLTLLVLALYLVCMSIPFAHLIWLPVVILLQAALCLGLALFLCTINVFFRDAEHIISIFTLGWFFLTPIFYPVNLQLGFVPASLNWTPFLNPMTGIVSCYRAIFMSYTLPPLAHIAVSFSVTIVVMFTGLLVFQTNEKRFTDEL